MPDPADTAAEPKGPTVIVLEDAPVAGLSDVAAAVLDEHFVAARATGQLPRVDYGPGDGTWHPATVTHVLEEDTVMIELDHNGQPVDVLRAQLRPHRPCRCADPDKPHAAGDIRYCLAPLR